MRNARVPLIALGAYLALIGALAASTPGVGHTQAGQQGPDVRVVNKPSQPVPVSIQGAAHIDTSSPIPVRDVDRRAQEPVQFTLETITGTQTTYTVPDGKELVIEFASGNISTTPLFNGVEVAEILLEIRTTEGAGVQHHFSGPLARYKNGVPDPGYYVFSQACRMYAKAGDKLILEAHAATVAFSGYLVDLP